MRKGDLMHLVLLSGGSGKRLWPLSNDTRSKQFLRILQNKDNQLESMVQRVWNQLKNNGLDDKSIIATSKSQQEIIQNQLHEDIPLVLEPERRDTFAAIALSVTYLYTVKGLSKEDVISILPVDPYVDDAFFKRIIELENTIVQSSADIALMGVKPTYSSEKYGYILPKSKAKEYFNVKKFTEKPDKIKAKSFIEQGALWNCGVFAFRIGYVLNILRDLELPIDYFDLYNNYESIPKNSFDFEVVEKADKIVALPYKGEWKDLGTWNTLTEEMNTPIIGKGKTLYTEANTHLINELDIPVNILGLSNVVVAASPDGILVSHKDYSPKVKEVIKDNGSRPMYEERKWGWFKILDYYKDEVEHEVITKKVCVRSKSNLSYQAHQFRNEHWTIIKGKGKVIINDKEKKVTSGDQITINMGTKHALYAESTIEMIEVQRGKNISDLDTVRFAYNWDQIEGYSKKLKM